MVAGSDGSNRGAVVAGPEASWSTVGWEPEGFERARRVAALRRAEYEWAQHVHLAREAGLGDEEIERVLEGPGADGWSPLDATLLTAVDELVADAGISDATWSALAATYDVQQLMDLVFTIGAYELLAMAFNSFGLQLDEDLEATRPRLGVRSEGGSS